MPRGEKEHQAWAQANVDFLNGATNKANARIPYFSTVQIAGPQETNFVHIQTDEGDELVKMELALPLSTSL